MLTTIQTIVIKMKKLALALSAFIVGLCTFAQTPAFPGAEGFGKYALGARAATNPTIYHVTNLNDSGTGSLRDAISQPNRFIVFDVAGVINIKSRLIFSSNLTVAGQTAPGDGIVVYGNGVSFSGGKNIIVRHMRFRMGIKGDSGKDAAGVANGTDMIFDHCSFTWGRDETFSISWDNKGTEPGNITIQNSIIGQGIMTHSAGGLIQTNGGVTLYRNLYIDNKTRNPKVKGLNQYVNNVVYNWGSGGGYLLGDSEGASWGEIVNNYFIKGPDTGGTTAFGRANENFQLLQSGNYIDYTTDGILNGYLATAEDYGPATFRNKVAEFTNAPKVHPVIDKLLTAEESYNWIVDSVGTVIPARDQVDKFMIDELTSLGTKGALINGESDLGLAGNIGLVFSATQQLDSDNDGIPDAWEDLNGLDKNNPADALQMNGNYYNIEHYINSIKHGHAFVKYPTGLSVSGIETNYINLKWTNNAEEATAIRLSYATNDGGSPTVKLLDAGTASYKIENLNPNTSYQISLQTINGELESLSSAILKVSTLGEAIPPIVSVNPVPADQSEISEFSIVNLKWENTTGAWAGVVYYNLFVGQSADNLQMVASNLTSTSYNLMVDANSQYFWRVDASNLLGNVEGTVWRFTTSKQPEREKAAYWRFDEKSGTTATNEINGFATARNFSPVWIDGKLNNAIEFPGTSNSALVQDHYGSFQLGNVSFSIEFWFKSPHGNVEVDYYFFHKGSHEKNTSTGASGKWMGVQYQKKGKTDRFTWAIKDGSTKSDLNITPGSTYFNNQWRHVVCVRDKEQNQLRVYIDGELKGSIIDNTGDIGEVEEFIIGNRNVVFDNPYQGQLDELSIYKGVLGTEEILSHYLSGSTGVFNNKTNQRIYASPTPFTNQITLHNLMVESGKAQVEIYTLSGMMVYSDRLEINNHTLSIHDLEALSRGIYVCNITINDKKQIAIKLTK